MYKLYYSYKINDKIISHLPYIYIYLYTVDELLPAIPKSAKLILIDTWYDIVHLYLLHYNL